METKLYEVSFILEQKGDYTDWISEVLASGLRDNELIYNLEVYEMQSHDLEVH